MTKDDLEARYRGSRNLVERSHWHFIRKMCKPELAKGNKLQQSALGRSESKVALC